MRERIQKVLSAAGVDSRRHIEEMVLQGRITVNGRKVTSLPVMIDPDVDRVSVDGEKVKLRGHREVEPLVYVLVNKPKNVFSTNVSQGEQKRVVDLLPKDFPRVYPVGRLDHDSRGLILLTNDGALTHQLTHAKFGIAKMYRVVVDGNLEPDTLELLRQGVWLVDPHTQRGFKSSETELRVIERSPEKTALEVTMRQSRNREIRRMMARVGHKVRDLVRVKFGPLTLEGVAPGKWRLLSPGEITRLKAIATKSDKSPAASKKPKHSSDGRKDRAKVRSNGEKR